MKIHYDDLQPCLDYAQTTFGAITNLIKYEYFIQKKYKEYCISRLQ
jgi:hypothetical protein